VDIVCAEKERKMIPGEPTLARQVFERGYKDLKSKNLKSSKVYFDTWAI
jgi:crooked neck